MNAARRYEPLALIIAIVCAVTWIVQSARPTKAMPPFAQAYGMNCDVCHSIVPALNAYGRYVQRTDYSSLDPSTIHRANPLWIGESPFYDTQDPAEPHRIQGGNFALHAAGYIGQDVTFHAHQWVWQSGQPGGTDTLWFTYNNLLHRDGHLSVGKIESPAPSPFSQWFDLSAFAPPGITVGEHAYQLDANRWGAKLVYVHNWLTAAASYLGANGDLNTIDFSSAVDKSFQWRLAYADPRRPLEAGFLGTSGVTPISDGTFDHYNATDVYIQLDAPGHAPGFFTMYQVGHDPNPGAGLPSATSRAFTAEIYQPVLNRNAMLGLRDEITDDGLGTITHTGNIDLAGLLSRRVTARSASGIIFNLEAGLAQGGGPAWRGQIWYVTTLSPLR